MTAPGPVTCRRCGRSPEDGEGGLGWSLARAPRPTGVRTRTPEQEAVTALCPECLRRHVRDV
jgi:hypothetical protein